MNIVELSNHTAGYDSDPRGSDGWVRRTFGKPSTGGLAALLLAAGFLLVLASQWFPMVTANFDVPTDDSSIGNFDLPKRTANMATAETIVQIPYYLIWLVVFVALGALVFAPRARRQILFGVTAGALGAQAMLVLPILRDPSQLVVTDISQVDGLTVRHSVGSYFLIAAFLVLAVAMVVAVGGRILPSPEVRDDDVRPGPVDVPTPRPTMYEALSGSAVPHGDADADIEFGSSFRGGLVDITELGGPDNPAADHDIYRRPTTDQLR